MGQNLKSITCHIFGLIFILFFTSPVSAQYNYLIFKGGIYEPNSEDLKDFNTGFAGEIAYGYHFKRTLALELGLGYLETDGNRGPAPDRVDITSVPLTVSLKAFYPVTKAGSFYGLAGIGVWFTEAEFTTGGIKLDDNDESVGVQLGFGFNYDFNRSVFSGMEGKYFWSQPGFQVLGTTVNQDLRGFIVAANFGIRF